ncbi:MAG: hypothetical protein DPW09_10275 [Anaerolineae bacterium]|nr:DJ-1/PfpI family protein [Anaerolineales bacterium]MCQ3973819.1 hypothetical protein [Anaerolineae bacterium]
MTKSNNYTFVLWGHSFEEYIATTFVTHFREAGLLVKVVGVTPGQISGAHGLTLVPDLMLSKAMPRAAQAICVVIPAAGDNLVCLKNDPRLLEFFRLARSNGAKFVVGALNEADFKHLELLSLVSEDMLVYPASDELVEFVTEVAGLLTVTS